nr:MAG TPA: hypothetical protein [Caudoviricetes sp.]
MDIWHCTMLLACLSSLLIVHFCKSLICRSVD